MHSYARMCHHPCLCVQTLAVKASLNVRILDVSPPYWTIFKEIWVHALSVFMVFTVTLSLFPAVISIIESTVPNSKASHWTGMCAAFSLGVFQRARCTLANTTEAKCALWKAVEVAILQSSA